MRYVNCEYGLPFRPPRAAQFSAVTTKGARLSAESFPKKVTVGAGLDFAVPNGVLLCGSRGSLWGIEADGCLDRKAFREGRQYLDDPRARLKCAEDFSCAAFAAADIAFTAVRIGENGILIRIPLPKKRRARVRLYIPFGWPGTLDVEGVRVRGRAPYVGIIPGTVTPTPSGIAEIKGRYRVEQDDLPGRELFIFESDTAPASVEKRGAEVHFVFAAKAREAVVTLFAAVGGAGVLSERPPTAEDAAPLFEAAARVLAGRQMSGKGLGQAASSLYWGVLSSRIYNPYLMSVVCTPSRTGMDRFFNADGTADNAMAVLMSLIADAPRLYPGDYGMLVPAAWEAYAHASDKSTILTVYSALVAQFPAEPKLSGAGEGRVHLAYRLDGSPLKEVPGDAPAYSLDQSCLKLLAYDFLERVGLRFDLPEAKAYAAAKAELIKLVNEVFWKEDEGVYCGRTAAAEWLNAVGVTSFYPLIAGAVTGADKLSALINTLSDPKRFWGDCVVPALSRAHPVYGKKVKLPGDTAGAALERYRGTVLPCANYLVWQGLVRYGLCEFSQELAAKSVRLYEKYNTALQEGYALFRPAGGPVSGARGYTGLLLAYIAVRELLDVECYRADGREALRFGTLLGGAHRLEGVRLHGRRYDLAAGATVTTLAENGAVIFIAEGGRFVVRQYCVGASTTSFYIHSTAQARLSVRVKADGAPRLCAFAVPEGKSKVTIEDGVPHVQMK